MQNWEHRSFNLKWRECGFPDGLSDEMLFENVGALRGVQTEDIVPFKPAVPYRAYLEAGGIDSEMAGNLVDNCGKICGQDLFCWKQLLEVFFSWNAG